MQSVVARRGWLVAYWLLFAAFVATAALNMLHVRGGILTNYAADVVVPAWLYITTRGLHQATPTGHLPRLIGWSPELTAAVLFLGSTATELAQRYWPQGIVAGRYDPADIVAFSIGVGVSYAADRFLNRVSDRGHR